MGRIKNIDGKVDKILKAIDNKTIYKAQKYDELQKLLKFIKLKVDIKERPNANGDIEYVIEYKTKTVLSFDEDGEMFDNNVFMAINMLDLISIEDMQRFSEILFSQRKIKK